MKLLGQQHMIEVVKLAGVISNKLPSDNSDNNGTFIHFSKYMKILKNNE